MSPLGGQGPLAVPTSVGLVIDSHTHVDDVPQLGWVDPAAKIVEAIDRAGIARAVVMTYTEAPQLNPGALEMLASAVAEYPDRLVAYARLHPWYDNAPMLLRHAVQDLGMRGLKLHPVGTLAHPADGSTLRLIETAAALGIPVLFHCGDEPMTTPLAIAEAARRVNDAAIILGHMGGYFHTAEAIAVAERLPNVFLETSAMPYPAMITRAVARVGSERVIFASDGPGCDPVLELQKVLFAGLDTTALRRVLRENIEGLLAGVAL